MLRPHCHYRFRSCRPTFGSRSAQTPARTLWLGFLSSDVFVSPPWCSSGHFFWFCSPCFDTPSSSLLFCLFAEADFCPPSRSSCVLCTGRHLDHARIIWSIEPYKGLHFLGRYVPAWRWLLFGVGARVTEWQVGATRQWRCVSTQRRCRLRPRAYIHWSYNARKAHCATNASPANNRTDLSRSPWQQHGR